MAYFKYDESLIVLGSGQSVERPKNINDYKQYHFNVEYVTDAGKRKHKMYSTFAFTKSEAHRKIGDIFRHEYQFLQMN